jgi:4-diphosphocytidyl-2-C-methyl-D-erythritol kinase
MSNIIKATSPAKVNLVFEVGGIQPDGYHPVNSLFLALDLREELTLVRGETGTGVSIYVHGETLPERHIQAVPTDETNLVYKVAQALANRHNIPTPDLQIDIHKRIPVAGGMAGGSSDAAAMLVALNEFLYQEQGITKLSVAALAELGATLGSDIPFCLYGGLAIGTNRGEQIQELPNLQFESNWLLCISNQGLSTPLVFHKFDELSEGNTFSDLEDLGITSASELALVMSNDLEEAALALMPTLADLKEQLEELGALRAMVSGSGPTIAALFDSAQRCNQVVELLKAQGIFALSSTGPSAGARLEG